MKPPVRKKAATAGENADLTGPWYAAVMGSPGWRWGALWVFHKERGLSLRPPLAWEWG